MKTIKLFFMAALALLMTACSSNDDNDIAQQPQKSEGIPFTATISVGNGATTRALEDNGTSIKATWVAGEKVALIHNGVSDIMEVSSVSGGVATITGTITGSPITGDAVTVIYPSTAADGTTGNVKSDLLLKQDGTLTGNETSIDKKYDVRKGTGTLKVDGTASLNGNVSVTNQFAILKLTLTNAAKNLCIMVNNTPIVGATLTSVGNVFTVAIPAVSSQTVTIVATDENSNCFYLSKDDISIDAGKYYQSSPAMNELDMDSAKDEFKIIGSSSTTIITEGKTAVLLDVNITSGNIICSGNATIILMGSNTITAGDGKAAIHAGGTGTTLTITGTGSLTATGYNSAGIGTGNAEDDNATCGNITILGGIITATGDNCAAGIGTGNAEDYNATCGNITILGGIITATGDDCAAGIGTGNAHNGKAATCGNITISGSATVTATGGEYGAGIGTGKAEVGKTTCGNITISGSAVVNATGGINGSAIGNGEAYMADVGREANEVKCGDIIIEGGNVMAKSGGDGPVIGIGNAGDNSIARCGNIRISKGEGFVCVTAIRIGSGYERIIGIKDDDGQSFYFHGSVSFDDHNVGGIPDEEEYNNLLFAISTTDDGDDGTDDVNNTWTLTPKP